MGLRLLSLVRFVARGNRFWLLFLDFGCRALRHVAAEIPCEFAPVVCIDLRVVLPTRDQHVSRSAIHQLRAFFPVHLD